MTEPIRESASHALMREMGMDETDVERRKNLVGLGPADIRRLATIRDAVVRHVDEHTNAFFEHLASLDEARPLVTSRALWEKARELKREHLIAMMGGEYDVRYATQRLDLAALYARAGLEPRVFMGAFHALLASIGRHVALQKKRPSEAFEAFLSFEKVAYFDVGLIVDVLVFERERVIRQQQEAIRELSTPVLQIRDRLLLLPIIGVIDTHRARMITESLLRSIRATRARAVVMDVTGVATIDSKVANHILQTVTAARLMGARVIVTGLTSEVAQSLAALGIELSKLHTVGDLQGGLEDAEHLLGYRFVASGDAAPGAVPLLPDAD